MVTRLVFLVALLMVGWPVAAEAEQDAAAPASATKPKRTLSTGIIVLISLMCALFLVVVVCVVMFFTWRRWRRLAAAKRTSRSTISAPIMMGGEKPYSMHSRTMSSFSAGGSTLPCSNYTPSPSIPSMLAAADAPSALAPQPTAFSRSPSLFSRSSIRHSPSYRHSQQSYSYSNPNLHNTSAQTFYTTRSSRGTQSTTTFRTFTTVSEYDAPQVVPAVSSTRPLPSSAPPPRPPRPPRADGPLGLQPAVLFADPAVSHDHHRRDSGGRDEWSMSMDHSTLSHSHSHSHSHSQSLSHHSHSHSTSDSIASLPSPSLGSHPFNRADSSAQYMLAAAGSSASADQTHVTGTSPTSSSDHTPPGSSILGSLYVAPPSSPLRPPPRPKPRPNHPRV